MSQLEKIIRFINETCVTYNIDDSHDLRHSLEVLGWSDQIKNNSSRVLTHKEAQIIHLSCLLHDMCDKKYMDEAIGLERIKKFLKDELEVEEDVLEAVVFIISTMSYSKVIKQGYPQFNMNYKELEYCYHVVRNSDLLCSYDPERCINYQIRCGGSRKEGIKKMLGLFDNRVLMLLENNYINLEEAKPHALQLHNKALLEVEKYKLEYSLLE
jgi:hypothetical protein